MEEKITVWDKTPAGWFFFSNGPDTHTNDKQRKWRAPYGEVDSCRKMSGTLQKHLCLHVIWIAACQLWLPFFWKNVPAIANQFLLNSSTSYHHFLFLARLPNLPLLSSSSGSTTPMCALKSPATHSIDWPSLRPANLSTYSLKVSLSTSILHVWGP